MKKYVNYIIGLLGGIGLVVLPMACKDSFDDTAFVTDVSVDITAFEVEGKMATIDQQNNTITTTLPYGTNVSALTPIVTIAQGASVSPEVGATVDFSNSVPYQVIHGNIYKEYTVAISNAHPILSFSIDGQEAVINYNSHMITLTVDEGTDLTGLTPEITLSEGVSITPNTGTTLDFTLPVTYTVSSGNTSEEYTAVVTTPVEGPVIAFLGTATNAGALTNPDEIAAKDWLFEQYNEAQYLSFSDIASGVSLEAVDVIWWHYDSAANLPSEALNNTVTSSLQNYLTNGGNILLSTFASQYVEALNIVPSGYGPNNVFGDFPPAGFVDSNDWGISFVGNETHPVFSGLQTYANGKANFLEGGTFRLNHTAWWFLPDWGGYGDGQGWRDQTGGTNLASEAWDDNLDGRVLIAEFPAEATDINAMIISFGAYDWYNEADSSGNPSQSNAYLDNIKILTANSLNYLATN
ncbi:protein of unknown function [Pustulibacterium marinum]|uniref:DUF4960 domain-containing protein n=1 Tax=Pustulibacterium marinum TaxID=1224947 RepID=A0A1I7H6P2_9FLAO|nr:DUF4960 domain-containing protein [Pustulibacterium marinum]SFU56309.1 protein of unknown function [Pustulibacterium marinum]